MTTVLVAMEGSQAVNEPFVGLWQPRNETAEHIRLVCEHGEGAVCNAHLEAFLEDLIREFGTATTLNWLPRGTLLHQRCMAVPYRELDVQRAQNEAAIHLLRRWLADTSGYEERTWPMVKQTIEEGRLSSRRPFDGSTCHAGFGAAEQADSPSEE